MWMRRGSLSCWKARDPNDPDHVSRAIEDLIRRGDEKPSFFQVHGCEEVYSGAELFAATVLQGPNNTDFLLLPESELAGFFFSLAPDPALHPFLRQKHFELQGVDNPLHLEAFVRRAFGIVRIERLKRKYLIDAFRERLRHDDDVLSRCDDHWKRL